MAPWFLGLSACSARWSADVEHKVAETTAPNRSIKAARPGRVLHHVARPGRNLNREDKAVQTVVRNTHDRQTSALTRGRVTGFGTRSLPSARCGWSRPSSRSVCFCFWARASPVGRLTTCVCRELREYENISVG